MNGRKYWNSHLKAMEGYTYGIQPEMTPDTVKLNTNECPYPPSPRAIEAIREAAGDRLRLYPSATWNDLRLALSEEYGVVQDSLFCSNGSDEFLSLLFRTFAEPGDDAVLTDPTYSLYGVLASAQGVNIRSVKTTDDFTIDFEALAEERGKLLLITNPNAPTGILAPLDRIEQCIRSFPGVVVVDEAYIDFSDYPEKNTALSLLDRYDNLLVARTFSKSFALCGIRAGYAFGHPDLIAALMTAKDSYNLDMLAQAAAAAAVRDIAWMRQNAARVRDTRERSAEHFRSLGFSVVPSQANFLFVTHPVLQARAIYDKLLEKRIYVRHFPLPGLDNHLRVTIGTDREMDRLFETITAVIGSGV